MIASIFFISLIAVTVSSIYLLDHIKIKSEYRNILEGLLFGIIAVVALNIHFNLVEPKAIFPKINVFVSFSNLVAISFFLFGFKAGLITSIFLFTARVFLTEEFLVYSLALYVFSALNGYYFNKIHSKKKSEINSQGYNIILLFLLVQVFISFIVFLIVPGFEENFSSMLIFLFPIQGFISLIISMTIARNRYQMNLLSGLKHEKSLLSNVLFNLSEAIIVIDNQLNILRINNLAQILTGYNSSEINGKKLSDICLLKDKQLAEEIFNQITNNDKNEIISHSDITIISKNGEEISVDCKISCVFDKESNQNLFVILFRDIRELKNFRQKIEESEKRFRQFFDFSLEGIWRYQIKNPVDISLPADEQIKLFFEEGYLAECNDVFAKMYGFESKNDLIGIPLSATLIPDDENNINYLKSFINNNYRLSNAESVEKDKSGNTKYFLNSLYGIIEDNFIVGAWGIQIDVTEDKLTSKQIRDNNRLLLSILNAPQGIIIFSLDKNYCYTSFSISYKETMKQIWGVEIQIGMNMLDAIKLEQDRVKAKDNFDKVFKGEHITLVERLGDENSTGTYWLNFYSPIYDESEVIGVAVFVTNISHQKEIEAELEKKNILLNTLLNTLPDSICVKDASLKKILVNKTFIQWMGYDDENQILGKRDDEIFTEDFAKELIEEDKRVLQGIPIINKERKLILKNGEEIIVLTNKIPIYDKSGEIIGLVGIGRDITEEKKYLNELEKNQQKLNIIFNQSFQFIGLLTPTGILLEANQTACDFIGVDVSDVKNLPFTDTPWWNHSTTEQDKLRKAIKSAAEGNFFRMETTHLNKEKKERIIDFSLMPIKNSEGKVVYLIAEGRDITDSIMLQKRLTESEEKYKILVDASMDAISIINSEGTILFENEKHKELFKSFSEQNLKTNYFNLISRQDIEKFKSEIKVASAAISAFYITLRFMRNSNDIFWGELSLKKFIDSEGQDLFMCVLRDITFRKQIEDELKKRVFELEKYNQLMIGREMKMIELKKEVNALCKQFGLPLKYSDDDI